jgi:hypothetical protein
MKAVVAAFTFGQSPLRKSAGILIKNSIESGFAGKLQPFNYLSANSIMPLIFDEIYDCVC